MKKLILVILGLWVGMMFAGTVDSVLQNLNQAFEITSKSPAGMELSFTIPHFEITTESVGNKTYQRLNMPGSGLLMESGMPELPTVSTTIAVPAHGSFSIESLGNTQRVINQYLAYPLQHGAELDEPKSFVLNTNYYSTGSLYPEAAIQYSDPMILRDFRIITIQINPFTYNSETGQLTVRETIDFRVNFNSSPGINELATEPTQISSAFASLYEGSILNFADYRTLIAHNPPRYLLIHGQSTDATFNTALDEYVLWKRQKGADVDVANTSTGQAGNSTSSIQTYIRGRYNNPDTRPDFVILLGDTGGNFAVPAFTNNGGGSDYPFTFMNTGDILGDVFIGRISVENTSQLLVLLNKIYIYERDINIDTAGWLNKMLLVGDNAPSGISTMYISKYIKEMALEVNPDYTFTELYGSDFNSFASGIASAFNQGIGVYSFRGYIDFSPPTDSALSNGFKLPHAVIITCGTGNYSGGTGETETLIRYGTSASPKGSVTAIGMSTASTHTTFNNVLHGGIFDGIFVQGMRTMGESMLHGKLYMNQIFGVSSPLSVEKFTHWCNLMGDPTMEVYVAVPNVFTVQVQPTIPVGLSLLDIAVSDSSGVVEGASVTLTADGQVVSRGYTDAEGNVILILPSGLVVGTGKITVSKHDYKPLQTEIAILNEGTLVPGLITIDDDNFGASQGNDNDIANGGETLELLFGLQNTSTNAITGISGFITSSSPYVTIADSTVAYADVAAGAMTFNNSQIVLQISGDAPHGSMLRLHLNLTDALGNHYDVSEFIPVESARFIYDSCAVMDGGNGALDPNETAPLNVALTNTGYNSIVGMWGRLYSLNDLVTISDNIAYFGDVAVGASIVTTTDNFSVYAREQILPGMVIPMQVKLYNDAGFEQLVDFSITISVVTIQDPLGPDTYGYVIFDDQDWNYAERPVYEWIGIAPAEGGVGTLVPLTDSYASGNEGDQVGANAIATVELPFPFRFYGREYGQVSISSNGFIAMGVSMNAEFRNFRLPGAMGPSPMIAPFWDDLATHSGGGVYTWFDRNNHAFVVEWYNLKNGYNGTSLETFQVIMYDQAIYSTSMGDGPIKIQYHTFNNVDSQSGNRHGNYSTIGIEDHTGTRGLEYTFNNIYPTAASPLGNQRALFITNVPVYHQEAHLIVGNTNVIDANGNGVAEPGERVELGIQLNNIGNIAATEIVTLLSTDNTNVSLLQADSEYYPLEAEANGYNRDAYVFVVSENCPDGEVVNFNLHITAGEVSWDRPFSVRVDASKLSVHSIMINDADAQYNGIIDIGETVKLIVNVKNPTAVEARDVVGTLSTDYAGVVIANPNFAVPAIQANNIMQFVYDLTFSGSIGSGTYLSFDFETSSSNALDMESPIYVPYNISNEYNDLELNNGDLISELGWSWGTPAQVTPFSGTKVWATNLSGSYPELIDYKLFTPTYLLTTNSELKFKHSYMAESGYDGGNVSISTNGGDNWTILTPQGGYSNQNLTGLNGEPGYSGSSNGWQTATFPLSTFTGQNVSFRFRFGSDGGTNNLGWFIDDFDLSGVDKRSGSLHGLVVPTSEFSPSLATVHASNNFATHPANDGSFKLYLKNASYYANAEMKNHQSSSFGPFNITATTPDIYTEFTLIYLPKPFSATVTVDNQTGLLNIAWTPPYDPVLPVTGYKIYKRFDTGSFAMVEETTETVYTETLSLEGIYQYYIRVKYINVEGSPSDTLNVPFPYSVGIDDPEAPILVTNLKTNYPNPFNPTTTISFDLAESGSANLRIYNLKGQLVTSLMSGEKNAGRHHLVWNGRDDSGRPVASGVYLYRLDAGGYSQTKKMMLIK